MDRVRFDRMLAASAAQAGADLKTGARLRDCVANADGSYSLRFMRSTEHTGEESATADFVIDATGRGSTLARRFDARHAVFDRLVGVAALLDDPSAGSHCYTLVETTQLGWWYSAPIGNEQSIAMLMSDGDIMRSARLQNLDNWQAALAATDVTRVRMSAGQPCGVPRIHCAVSQRLIRDDRSHGRWLAVGDAALSVDPISGSGVVRALSMAKAAAMTVVETLGSGRSAIETYETERDRECTAYLFERSAYYELERRWPSATFWQRRLQAMHRGTQLAA